eukprot:jgi/Mesvir1/2792/Mv21706-RA.1
MAVGAVSLTVKSIFVANQTLVGDGDEGGFHWGSPEGEEEGGEGDEGEGGAALRSMIFGTVADAAGNSSSDLPGTQPGASSSKSKRSRNARSGSKGAPAPASLKPGAVTSKRRSRGSSGGHAAPGVKPATQAAAPRAIVDDDPSKFDPRRDEWRRIRGHEPTSKGWKSVLEMRRIGLLTPEAAGAVPGLYAGVDGDGGAPAGDGGDVDPLALTVWNAETDAQFQRGVSLGASLAPMKKAEVMAVFAVPATTPVTTPARNEGEKEEDEDPDGGGAAEGASEDSAEGSEPANGIDAAALLQGYLDQLGDHTEKHAKRKGSHPKTPAEIAWARNYARAKAQHDKEVNAHRRRQAAEESKARGWGEAVAAAFLANVCDTHRLEDADNSSRKDRLVAVRDCTRAVIGEMGMEAAGKDELAVRISVQVKLGWEFTGSLKSVIRQELAHLSNPAMVAVAQEAFTERMASSVEGPSEAAGGKRRKGGVDDGDDDGEGEEGEGPGSSRSQRAPNHVIDMRSKAPPAEMPYLHLLWQGMEAVSMRFAFTPEAVASIRNHSECPLPASLLHAAPLVLFQRLFLDASLDRVPDEPVPAIRDGHLSTSLGVCRRAVGDVGSMLHRYEFPVDLLPLLPVRERTWRFRSCAIVGNSAQLLHHKHGKDIDSKEAVFRINMAPVKGYENHVGTKTTFDLLNQQMAKSLVEGRATFWRNSTLTLFEVTHEFSRRRIYPDFLRFFSGVSLENSHVVVLSPDLVAFAEDVWQEMKLVVENALYSARNVSATFHYKPMSGFFAVMFGLQICDHVNLYGFSRNRDKKAAMTQFRYFDIKGGAAASPPPNTHGHGVVSRGSVPHDLGWFDLGYEIFRQMALWPLSDVGPRITVYK